MERIYKKKHDRLLCSVSYYLDDNNELFISMLPTRIRVGVCKSKDFSYDTYFRDFDINSLKENYMITLHRLLSSDEKANYVLGKELVFKLINERENEFIQESLKRLKR